MIKELKIGRILTANRDKLDFVSTKTSVILIVVSY
jgi:hypothetical protein